MPRPRSRSARSASWPRRSRSARWRSSPCAGGRLRQQPAVPAYYRQALRLLSRGAAARREAGDTARAFVARATVVLGAGPALAFADVTELYLAERFGGRAPGAAGRRGAAAPP